MLRRGKLRLQLGQQLAFLNHSTQNVPRSTSPLYTRLPIEAPRSPSPYHVLTLQRIAKRKSAMRIQVANGCPATGVCGKMLATTGVSGQAYKVMNSV